MYFQRESRYVNYPSQRLTFFFIVRVGPTIDFFAFLVVLTNNIGLRTLINWSTKARSIWSTCDDYRKQGEVEFGIFVKKLRLFAFDTSARYLMTKRDERGNRRVCGFNEKYQHLSVLFFTHFLRVGYFVTRR